MRMIFPFEVRQKSPNEIEIVEGREPLFDLHFGEQTKGFLNGHDADKIHEMVFKEIVKASIIVETR